ncbi:MAG: hypothetical protein V4564_18715 [Pseudomonadota bacterium]
MRTRNLIALGVAATAACYLLIERSQTNGIIGFFHERLSVSMFACWFAGYIVVTISPATCAISFWLLAKRSRHGWILHLAVAPAIYAIFLAATDLMLFAAGEQDVDPLSARAIIPAMLLLMICPIVYFVALGFRTIGALRRRAKVG